MPRKKKEEITDIQPKETTKPVRMKDVAEKCGTSISTVSRVLNGIKTDWISKETEKRINEIAYTMGYKKNVFAQALKGGKTYLIDIQIPAQYFGMLYCFNTLSSDTEYTIINRDVEVKYISNKEIINLSVDGVISIIDGFLIESYMKTLPHRNCVSIGRNCSTKFDHIYEDFFDGTCDAIEYLIKTGCKKIGYLTDDLMVPKREEKVRAYLSTLEKHDLKPIFINTKGWNPDDVYKGVLSNLKSGLKVDAVFCHSDVRHDPCMKALQDYGLKVPKDVSVLTVGHITNPILGFKEDISGIFIEDSIICETAWDFLMNRIENPKLPIQEFIANYRFIKGSTTK